MTSMREAFEVHALDYSLEPSTMRDFRRRCGSQDPCRTEEIKSLSQSLWPCERSAPKAKRPRRSARVFSRGSWSGRREGAFIKTSEGRLDSRRRLLHQAATSGPSLTLLVVEQNETGRQARSEKLSAHSPLYHHHSTASKNCIRIQRRVCRRLRSGTELKLSRSRRERLNNSHERQRIGAEPPAPQPQRSYRTRAFSKPVWTSIQRSHSRIAASARPPLSATDCRLTAFTANTHPPRGNRRTLSRELP